MCDLHLLDLRSIWLMYARASATIVKGCGGQVEVVDGSRLDADAEREKAGRSRSRAIAVRVGASPCKQADSCFKTLRQRLPQGATKGALAGS